MKTETLRIFGRASIIFSLALMAGSLLYILFVHAELEPDARSFGLLLLVFSGFYFPLSWLIVSRTPRNIIGWLFAAAIIFFSVQMFGTTLREALGIQSLMVMLAGNLWLFGLLIPITVMLLYFPTGSLISNRWRLILFADLFGMLVLYLSFTIEDLSSVVDGAWIEAASRVLPPLQILIVIGLLGSLVSVILRYRSSTGVGRAQIKWLAYMAVVGILILLMSLMTGLAEESYGLLFFFSPPILIALAVGLAILRYRLYDIDIIIRRTLSYSILTAVLGGVFFGSVVLLQTVFGDVFGDDESPLITVVTTLAIAGLFNPLRVRIQDFIDRRFFRSKYDVEKALTAFSVVARDEVDLARLSGSLLSVVESTMRPEWTSLWLKQRDRKQGD